MIRVSMIKSRSRSAVCIALAVTLVLVLDIDDIEAQSALSNSGIADDPEFFVTLDAYVKYGGDFDVIDGLTGRSYHSDNAVVKAIHSSFPQIMGGLHARLLELEARYMNFYLTQGVQHERELSALAESFGITRFSMDRSRWMVREKAILQRLHNEPFFQIKELVIWEKEYLDEDLPDNKWAKNIRYNWETQSWERRILTEWDVNTVRVTRWNNGNLNTNVHMVEKRQGLNLETNKGFHIITGGRGLNAWVQPGDFKEVNVSYPIIVSKREDADEQIERLQKQIVENLSHLYDPFTWVARRSTRFRTAFSSELVNYFKERKYRVKDRDWFDPVICHFLNDVVTVNRYGFKEVYDLYLTQQFANSKNVLGKDLDLLNWHEGEKREGERVRRDRKIWLNYKNTQGVRFVLLDAYLRYGDKFVDRMREELTSSKKKIVGKDLIEDVIAKVSGVPAEKYIPAAIKAQRAGLEQFRQQMNF